MAVKGKIKPDHIPQNSFSLKVVGLPTDITAVMISGFDTELESVDLPDRTTASGGNFKHVEFEIEIPVHHSDERAALDAWLVEARLGLPTYKKAAALTFFSVGGIIKAAWTLTGLYPVKGAGPSGGGDMTNEGEMLKAKYSFKADNATPMIYK